MIRHSTFIRASRLIVLLAVVCPRFAIFAQATSTQTASDADAKVAAIMDDILKRGEGYVEGRPDLKTYTWVSPTPEDVKRIREIGHDAIASLSKALVPPYLRAFQRTLAVTLLGEIGGPDVVPPLKRALAPDNPNSVRDAALAALVNVPDELALPIIRGAVHDPDAAVAQRAKQLLTDYYQLDAPK